MSDPRDKPSSAVIVGLGRTGYSAAAYLRARGWQVALTDTRREPPELARLRALDPQITVRAGGLDASLLDRAVCVIASPGVPLSDPFFGAARRRGLEVIGDIELFALAVDAPVAGITGTNGKSTVTTLVGRMAQRAEWRVRVGGNLGEPALDLLAAAQRDPLPTQLYVLELSSFQLEATHSLHPRAATVLNVTPDHLDRYASVAEYAAAKARIFARCDVAVVNLDDPLVRSMPTPGQTVIGFSLQERSDADYRLTGAPGAQWITHRGERLLALAQLRIKGLHNAANALAALAVGEALGIEPAAMLTELEEFPGLPHRTQWVRELAGVTYVDDSKGTNVGATSAAVAGLPGPLVLIAGGDGKQQDFTPLAAVLRGKVRHAVLIGRDREALARVLEPLCPCERCDSLPEAVRAAARAARPGDMVLLSPACASLDMFRDYAHRGRVFTEAVQELAA
jgi:UDP-N-acetylmuramoylalanine--D-glutamate ligase